MFTKPQRRRNAKIKAQSLLCVRHDLSIDIIRNFLNERQGDLLDNLSLQRGK
jgi:hypothetical protein